MQLEESLKRCNREDQQFLMDELERLAGVGPGCAPKTVEMVPRLARFAGLMGFSGGKAGVLETEDSVERLVPGSHPAVLLRTAEARCLNVGVPYTTGVRYQQDCWKLGFIG